MGDRCGSCFTTELTCGLCGDRFAFAFSFTCLVGLCKDLKIMTHKKIGA